MATPNPQEQAKTTSTQIAVFADQQFALAQAYVIDSPAMYEAAADDLRTIESAIKKAEARRLEITRPLDAAKRSVMDLFKPPIARLEAASKTLRAAMVTFSEQQREKARQEREAAERAERERQAELERQANEARTKKAREAALQALDEAQAAPPPAIQTEVPKASGISGRSTWKVSSVDLRALIVACAQRLANGDDSLVAYLEANSAELASTARSLKDRTRIPGVTVEEVHSLAVRS